MQASPPFRLTLIVVALGGPGGLRSRAGRSGAAGNGPTENSLETRQFRMDNARLPGRLSARQSVVAWQVTQGTWNGQTLDGLSVVIVKSTNEDGHTGNPAVCCYFSHEG